MRLTLVTLVLVAALVAMSLSGDASTARGNSVVLSTHAGRARGSFALPRAAGVVLLLRLTVRHGVRAVADGEIPALAGVRVWSWPRRGDPALSCARSGAVDVCAQGEEWCPMPAATWRFRVRKLAGPAGDIRLDFVVGRPRQPGY